MPDRIDPEPAEHSRPHDRRTCHLCATFQHPALAKQGRALQAHLAEHPFPRQAVKG